MLCRSSDEHRRPGHSFHPRPLPSSERIATYHDSWLARFGLRVAEGRRSADRSHGSRGKGAKDAFHLVLPSIPGFGFSREAEHTGWNPRRIARAWDVLMKRLGYTRYVSQGGDWGAIISDAMGRQAPAGLLGIHVNRIERATTIPPEVAKALRNGDPRRRT